jgi:hypothetical protein
VIALFGPVSAVPSSTGPCMYVQLSWPLPGRGSPFTRILPALPGFRFTWHLPGCYGAGTKHSLCPSFCSGGLIAVGLSPGVRRFIPVAKQAPNIPPGPRFYTAFKAFTPSDFVLTFNRVLQCPFFTHFACTAPRFRFTFYPHCFTRYSAMQHGTSFVLTLIFLYYTVQC